MRLEVEDQADSVSAQRLLKKHRLNLVNRLLVRLVPRISKLGIVPLPAISGLARDSGSFTSVKLFFCHVCHAWYIRVVSARGESAPSRLFGGALIEKLSLGSTRSNDNPFREQFLF